MSKSSNQTLNEMLQSTSDCLFPEHLGKQTVEISSADVDGDTPLHALLWRKDTNGALLLIQHGADVNAVGDMVEIPLHVAIRQENLVAINAMLAVGAQTNIVSEFGSPHSVLPKK